MTFQAFDSSIYHWSNFRSNQSLTKRFSSNRSFFHYFPFFIFQINCEDWIQFHVMNDNSNVVMVNAYQFRLLVMVKMTVWMDPMRILRSVWLPKVRFLFVFTFVQCTDLAQCCMRIFDLKWANNISNSIWFRICTRFSIRHMFSIYIYYASNCIVGKRTIFIYGQFVAFLTNRPRFKTLCLLVYLERIE